MFREGDFPNTGISRETQKEQMPPTAEEWTECAQRYEALLQELLVIKEQYPRGHAADILGGLLASCEVIIDDRIQGESGNLEILLLRAEQYLDLLRKYPQFQVAEYSALQGFFVGKIKDGGKAEYVARAKELLESSGGVV